MFSVTLSELSIENMLLDCYINACSAFLFNLCKSKYFKMHKRKCIIINSLKVQLARYKEINNDSAQAEYYICRAEFLQVVKSATSN